MTQFSTTKPITKSNLDKVPGNKPGVYRIKNAKGEILYIGKAKGGRLNDRIWEHKGYFPGGTQFQYCTTEDGDAADRLEKEEIRKHTPPYNKRK